MSGQKENIFLVDGNSFCYRAFYALPAFTTSKGMPTNAIYGVVNMLRKLLREYEPDMMAVVFDLKGPTVRHKKYEKYKMQRKPMPDELSVQIPRIKEVIAAHNIPMYELQGYEADDIIATLARKASKKGIDVIIVSGDKDALQLVGGNIKVLSPNIKEDKVYDAEEVKRKYGVGPEKIVELMALMGDKSDNIPGVKGVGEVTARKLVEEYGSVEGIYKNADKISSASLKEKLLKEKDMAVLSRELVELDESLPVELEIKDMKVKAPDREKLAVLYKEFEFRKLFEEMVPAKSGDVRYVRHHDDGEMKKAADDMKKSGLAALSVQRSDGKVIGISFSWKEKEAHYVPLENTGKNTGEDILSIVKSLLESRDIIKVGHDIKNDIAAFLDMGISLAEPSFDVMVADYLLEPSRSGHALSDISMEFLGQGISVASNVEWDEGGQGTLDFSKKEDHIPCCGRSDVIYRLHGILEKELKEKHLMDLFFKVEMPLVKVLADMEREGVGIDIAYMKKLSEKTDKRLNEVKEKIYELGGEEFNINSPKQVQHILFEKLSLPMAKKTKTGASTDESVLQKLAPLHELPAMLLEYRTLHKLKTAYYDSILEMVDKKTKKLHTHFNQVVTSTGRLSSSEPNLQNIPVKTETGKEIRRAFTAGSEEKFLLAADYSQIELRILAHLSRDKNLKKAFTDGEDVHIYTAALIFGVAHEKVTPKMRAMAKTVNFGIIYGMSAFGLAKELAIGAGEAQAFIDSYFERYPGVKSFMEKTIESAREKGYVTTLLNRRRYIPEIKSPNEKMRGFAERTAINTPVQGSAADLIKLAMLECYRQFQGKETTMILQVHDELVFTVPKDDVKKTAQKVKNIMESVMDLDVPLVVNIEAGENWKDMEEVIA